MSAFSHALKYSFRQLLPLALLFSWVELVNSLFVAPESFLAQTSHFSFYSQKWLFILSGEIERFAHFTMTIIASYFVSQMITYYLKSKQVVVSFLPTLSFILTWVFVSNQRQFVQVPHQPFWILLVGFAILLLGFKKYAPSQTRSPFLWAILLALMVYLVVLVTKLMISRFGFGPDQFLQSFVAIQIGDGPKSFFQVLIWTALAIVLLVFGISVPDIFQGPAGDLVTTSNNLSSALSGNIAHLPHPFTFYTLRDSFAMFGGIGVLLGLLIAFLIASRLMGKKREWQIGLLCLAPMLFDANFPFLVGLPLILQPLFIIPMFLSTVMAETLGAILLSLNWLTPAVYGVPTATPSLLFGYLASNGDWRYLIVSIVIIILSVLIYLPFVNRVLKKGDLI
ncbi:hypothetical protein NC01_03790 [Streptococcus uberis]|nr:hypothetical protein NC01_03790 [Streptococcus uberis]